MVFSKRYFPSNHKRVMPFLLFTSFMAAYIAITLSIDRRSYPSSTFLSKPFHPDVLLRAIKPLRITK